MTNPKQSAAQGLGADTGPTVKAVAGATPTPTSCAEFRWSLIWFATINPGSTDPKAPPPSYATFGAVNAIFSLAGYPWLLSGRDAPNGVSAQQYYFPTGPVVNPIYRTHGYTMVSSDCGTTWTRAPEVVPPHRLDGHYDPNSTADVVRDASGKPVLNADGSQTVLNEGGNGVDHLITNLAMNPPAVASHIDFGRGRSRLYPLFASGVQWIYQGVDAGLDEPNPIIGSPDWNVNADNFYSPTIVPESGTDYRLYFGGWRDFTADAVGACQGPNAGSGPGNGYPEAAGNGPIEDACTCALKPTNVASALAPSAGAIDACTGDKIFVATNGNAASASNKLLFQVYRGNGQWSADAWHSETFEPMITPSKLNHLCLGTTCPFPLIHTNDPTVIKLPMPVVATFATNQTTAAKVVMDPTPLTYQYVMFFSGAFLYPSGGENYTHVAVSLDGLDWHNFAVLRHKVGVHLPVGQDYSESNGMVRAMWDASHNKIILMMQATDEGIPPQTGADPDVSAFFRFTVDPTTPNLVEAAGRFQDATGKPIQIPFNCPVGTPCGTVQ